MHAKQQYQHQQEQLEAAMNFFDNFLFRSVTDGLKKRVFKFIFKRTFDRFIKEIDLSQVDVQLFTGVVELENLELKIDVRTIFL